MKYLRSAIPIMFIIFLSGCSTLDIFRTVEERGGDLVDKTYATLAIFNEVDVVALKFGQKADTPRSVKDILKKLREPARASVPILAEAAKSYRAVDARLNSLTDPSTIEELTVAFSVLLERVDTYKPPIQKFIDYVNKL